MAILLTSMTLNTVVGLPHFTINNIHFAVVKYHVCMDHAFSDTNTKQVWLAEDLAQDATAPLLSATGEKHDRAEGILFPPNSIRQPHILLLYP